MKQCPTPPHLQFKLELADQAPAELPADRSEELVRALVDLLLGAVPVNDAPNANRGGHDEPETDE